MSPNRRPGNFKLRAARIIRSTLVVLLAGVVLVIASYLILQINKAPRVKPDKKDIVPKKVGLKEQVRVFQYHKEKGLIEAQGARNYPVDENFSRLEGNVELVDRGRKGGREIRITGDLLTYDKEMTGFLFQGHVLVQYKGVTLDAPDFEYNRKTEIVNTTRGVTVTSPQFKGSAQIAAFHVKEEDIVLEQNVQFSIQLRLPTPEPLVLTGNKLAYGFLSRRGDMEGNVSVVHGKSRGTADHVSFEQFEKVDDLRVLWLRGNVQLNLEEERPTAGKTEAKKASAVSEPQGSTISSEFRLNQSVRQEIGADSVRLQAFMNLPLVQSVECRDRSAIKFIYDSGDATEIRGETIDLTFSKDGSLRELKTEKKTSISSLDREKNIVRVIEGAAMTLDAGNSVLHVTGGEGQKARIESAQSKVSGDTITILVKLDNFEVKGSVQMSFLPSRKGPDDKGFFSGEQPVFANAGSLRYSNQSKRFLLWEKVRTWQGQKVLSAEEVNVTEEMGDLTCKGSVESVFPHKTKKGDKEQQVRVSADRMRFDHEANQVIYEDNCTLRTGTAVLECGLITVDPGEGGGSVISMRASKGTSKAVTIVMGTKEATGAFAEYDVEKDTIVVTGQPVLKEKDKGTVRGDKLTFRLADGTIRVENRDQEQSVAVNKS